MTPPQALAYALLLFAGASVCGLILLRTNPSAIIPLALVGLACAILYSAVLKKYALGDLLIVVAFGLGLTLGAYVVQAGEVTIRQWLLVSLLSLPICLLVDAILHANNLRDAADDRTARVRTLATTLSPAGGQQLQVFLLFGPLAFVLLGVLTGFLPVWSLGTLLALPLLLRAVKTLSVEGTAQTHLVFGLLYAASFLPRPVFLWS